MLVPVIISGGAGSRLWPVSRELHPKPFMQVDGQSLIQKTFLRAAKLDGVSNIVTVTSKDTVFLTRDAYAALSPDQKQHFVLEPMGRNTAPAIAASALYASKIFGDDAVLLILS
jgi:mannose-1-phosphate guanylyltransferase